RCLPEGLSARIDRSAVRTPAIFSLLQRDGGIEEREMFNTFNMGVGMAVIVSPADADRAVAALDCGAYPIGEIVAGEGEVLLV
ncbi:MAG: phosphoribosylformylglycinamidine cyclo-ligase, partial [Oscillibacter sp.]|nr:phosphoribosylformylglycinamidine cyclo-ligase [Oscillibacter sp.]